MSVRELFNLVHLHKEFNPSLLNALLREDPASVRNLATQKARQLYKMQRSVMRCLQLKKGFMRFNISSHGILYAKTTLPHPKVMPLLLLFFHDRFPKFHVLIECDGATHHIDLFKRISVKKEPLSIVLESLESELPVYEELMNFKDDESLWKQYYNSQFIKERRNLRLQKKMMPLKYRDSDSLESSKHSHTLLDYK